MNDEISLDADLESADWTKTAWDLPPYKSPEFFAIVRDLGAFRATPAYASAVRAGLIHDDEWVADYASPAPAPAAPQGRKIIVHRH